MSKSRILRYLVTVPDASATDVAVTLRLSLPASDANAKPADD